MQLSEEAVVCSARSVGVEKRMELGGRGEQRGEQPNREQESSDDRPPQRRARSP